MAVEINWQAMYEQEKAENEELIKAIAELRKERYMFELSCTDAQLELIGELLDKQDSVLVGHFNRVSSTAKSTDELEGLIEKTQANRELSKQVKSVIEKRAEYGYIAPEPI